MLSFVTIKIEGKDVKRFVLNLIKRGVKFENLDIYKHIAYLKVDKKNYEKIKQVKTIYKVEIVKLYGLLYLKDLFKRYYIFIVFLIYGIFLFLFLSNIIFEVEVIHSKKEIRDLIYYELEKREIEKFKFIKSFRDQEKIASEILEKNKDTLEWLEIERVGVKYVVRVEERIIKKPRKKEPNRSVVAGKTGVIKKIEASRGEVVRKINDYVKKGDIIISGNIKKNDDIKNVVSATGKVYAEVWYQVKVDIPYNYQEVTLTNNKKNNASFCLFNKCYHLFKPFDNSDKKSYVSLSNNLLPISFDIYSEKEKIIIDTINTDDEIINQAMRIASNKINKMLNKDGRILVQKKLKNTHKDSTMEVVVFFKVYENITAYSKVEKPHDELKE